MRSIVLVALQFGLLAVLAWPRDLHASWSAAEILLIAIGAALGVAALVANRPGNFNIRPDPKRGGTLVEHGIYRYVRHPMYLAVLVIALGLLWHDVVAWRALAFGALAVVLHAKAAVEEAAMQRLHPQYAAYRARTARIIPFVW